MKGNSLKFKKRFPALLLVFALLVTTFSLGGGVSASTGFSDRATWGGSFDPQTALDKQAPYDPDKYYVWYNGNFYTEADPADFDYDAPGTITGANGKINSYLEAWAVVTKDQFIKCVADSNGDLASWVAGEGLASVIGTAATPGPNAVWIDLKGATVIPGLIESHMHYTSTGILKDQIDVFQKSKADILAAVGAEAQRLFEAGEPTSTWIVSRGWLQTLGGDWLIPHPDSVDIWPTRWELDSVTRDKGYDYPVRLGHASGHGAWYNTAAMESSRWANDPENPTPYPGDDGEIIVNSAGKAIGVLISRAAFSAPGSTAAQSRAAIFAAEEQCLSYGLTTIMDAGSSQSTFNNYNAAYLGQLQDFPGRELKVRIFFELSVGAAAENTFRNSIAPTYAEEDNGRLIGAHGNRLTVRTVKIMADGALGARSAEMIDDYSDRPGHSGNPYITDAALYTHMDRNIRAGWQTSAHVIGDKSVRKYIETYLRIKDEILAEAEDARIAGDDVEAARLEALVTDDRQRPEHYQIVSVIDKDRVGGKNDIERAVEAGMVLSMQFVHATSDMPSAEDRVGPDRIRGGYAWRSIINLGGVIGNGTDSSVELLNPYHSLYAGVTRVSRTGTIGRTSEEGAAIDAVKFINEYKPGTKNFTEDSGWYADQRLTRAEALHYQTWGGAYANFEENIKGVLREGFLADFVVLDRDYFNDNDCWDFEIKDLNAVMTVLGGEIVYTMRAPVITTNLTALGARDVPYSTSLSATGTENFIWSIANADPRLSWATIDEYRGTISGVPTIPGTYEITIRAENYCGSDVKTLTITVDGELGFTYGNPKFISMNETAKNSRVWVLTFSVDKIFENGEKDKITVYINLNGNNANLDGKYTFGADHELAGYTLYYDIKGNGSNIKDFRLIK